MPNELIPLLSDLCFSQNAYQVDGSFVALFVRLHADNWTIAQEHWERIIERVLGTDAVEPEASGKDAMRQAVRATVTQLMLAKFDRCPLCPRTETNG